MSGSRRRLPEHGLDPAMAAGRFARGFDEQPHAGIGGEIPVDEGRRFLDGDADLPRQRARAHAVDDAEVDGLGPAAHVRGDVGLVDAGDQRRRAPVHVGAFAEGRLQPGIVGQVGQQSQFDLRIVRRQEQVIGIPRHESAPDLAPELGADRYVLQIRIRARQAPGGSHRLVVRGVDEARYARPPAEAGSRRTCSAASPPDGIPG